MLRSLVGSEMCIRDRYSIRIDSETGSGLDRSQEMMPMAAATIRSKRIRNCLLYTSDAADDLLCVDLGGRRIIKKKNHESNLLPYDKT